MLYHISICHQLSRLVTNRRAVIRIRVNSVSSNSLPLEFENATYINHLPACTRFLLLKLKCVGSRQLARLTSSYFLCHYGRPDRPLPAASFQHDTWYVLIVYRLFLVSSDALKPMKHIRWVTTSSLRNLSSLLQTISRISSATARHGQYL